MKHRQAGEGWQVIRSENALADWSSPDQLPRMCGRYGFGNPARFDALPFGVALPALAPRFNVSPSQTVPLVAEDPEQGRNVLMAKWGLVPSWENDSLVGNGQANARGDTVATKPMFRAAFKTRRALMPADLFYEWQVVPGHKGKHPWCIRLPDDEPFSFGAIWEQFDAPDDPTAEALVTCAIITTEPNELMATIHQRMPLIVPTSAYDEWLDPQTSVQRAQTLIKPYAGVMRAWRVSSWLNVARNDGPQCIEPLDITNGH